MTTTYFPMIPHCEHTKHKSNNGLRMDLKKELCWKLLGWYWSYNMESIEASVYCHLISINPLIFLVSLYFLAQPSMAAWACLLTTPTCTYFTLGVFHHCSLCPKHYSLRRIILSPPSSIKLNFSSLSSQSYQIFHLLFYFSPHLASLCNILYILLIPSLSVF